MEFRLLGPVEVRDGDRSLKLGGQKPRTLLAVLALDAGHVVGPARLAELIWEDDPPATASTQIQGYVSALRKQFVMADPGRQVIVTEPAGYRLDVRPGELDLTVFEQRTAEAAQALAAGRSEDATAAYREAQELWHGPALGGVAGTLEPARDRLEERRLTAFEGRIEADLRLGRDEELVTELRDVVAAHPFREGPRGQLMLALYRAGRAAEALTVYREARTILAEELGLDPGPELQRLEKAILVSDPTLEPPPSAAPDAPGVPLPAQLPPDILDFTGRAEQVVEVCGALGRRDDDPDEPPTAVAVALIAGRAGIGKTSLAVHAAHRMRSAFLDGQLHVNLHGAQDRPADPSEVLARFLRALGVAPARVPETVEERGELYRSRLAGRRVLVVLDNAADEAQVRPLLPGEPGCAVLVTSRWRLAGLEGARLVDLEILEPDAAFQLLEKAAGPGRLADERQAGEEIVRLCGYLPLAVRIAGAKLAANPFWSAAHLVGLLADERHRLDQLTIGDLEVRATLALSYHGLSEQEQQAFRRLGLLEAPDFAPWTVAALADVSQARAGQLVDALVRARLLDGARGPGGTVRFRFHDLLRLYARELARRDETPEEASAALARAFDGWCHGAEKASALTQSASFGIVHLPADGWRAEDGAFDRMATDPLGWYETEWPALLAVLDQALAQERYQLVMALGGRLGPFFVVRGRFDDWRHIAEHSLTAARRVGDPFRQAMALRALAELSLMRHRVDDARSQFEQAIDCFRKAGSRFGAALCGSGLGAALTAGGDLDAARERLEAALVELREVGDPRTLAWTLSRLGTLHRDRGDLDRAAEYQLEAVRVLGDDAMPVDVAAFRERLAFVRLRQGTPAEACELFEQTVVVRRAHRDRFGEAFSLCGLGEAQQALGRPSDALDSLTSALRRWRELELPVEQASTLALLVGVHTDLGDEESAEAMRAEAEKLTGDPDPE
ncbi:AfsR/SARP family transcriptional regulator [Pseudonocardia endophytica]|uniref:DNA-binding SARP family transcriptional activator n=1 Tax=Pseudonocardia endophytica TaxID=401976 RepID=A0A4R1HKJ5_PSEEN|nr:AfsR/SARP family transcriptional regulator [Pseudonocardia endophytica]TCK21581.1 DNA-binding SARP family transcriptional activator [Pseudonocardia endophytica]